MGCKQCSHSNSPSPSPVSNTSSIAAPSIQEREKFQRFVHLLGELHRRSNRCERIQQGSPGAGSLSSVIDYVKRQLEEVNVEPILTQYANLLFMTRLKRQYELFYEV